MLAKPAMPYLIFCPLRVGIWSNSISFCSLRSLGVKTSFVVHWFIRHPWQIESLDLYPQHESSLTDEIHHRLGLVRSSEHYQPLAADWARIFNYSLIVFRARYLWRLYPKDIEVVKHAEFQMTFRCTVNGKCQVTRYFSWPSYNNISA